MGVPINKLEILFKKIYAGKASAHNSRSYHEELAYANHRMSVFGSEVWSDVGTIPNAGIGGPTGSVAVGGSTASADYPQVKYYYQKGASAVPNTEAGWDFGVHDWIPFNYGDGETYRWILQKNDGTTLTQGHDSNWTFDRESGVLIFHNGNPSGVAAATPPSMSGYVYTGKKLSTGLATGEITSSGHISASGNIYSTGVHVTGSLGVSATGSFSAVSSSGQVTVKALDVDNNIVLSGDISQSDSTKTGSFGYVRAEGDISSSGTIYADAIILGENASGGGSTGITSTGDLNVDGNISASGDITGSVGHFTGFTTMGGNNIGLKVENDISASGIIADFVEVSSSIIFTTGSNMFGDDLTDTHEFSGSLLVTGSIDNQGGITKVTPKDGKAYGSVHYFSGSYRGPQVDVTQITASSANIDGGTIDGVSIGASSVATDLKVDKILIDGQTISTFANNDNINITPHGTGDILLTSDTIQIGDNNADVTLTTLGTGDLKLSTNGGTNSGIIQIGDGANKNINIIPNGTGDIALSADTTIFGSLNENSTLTTSGSADLTLSTNGGTDSGVITILDGADQNINITPDGTGEVAISKVNISAGTITGTTIGSTAVRNDIFGNDLDIDGNLKIGDSAIGTSLTPTINDSTDIVTVDGIFSGSIIPSGSGNFDLGVASNKFRNLEIEGTGSFGHIVGGSLPGSVDSSRITGSFTGSFTGDGSNLTGIVTTLAITASEDGSAESNIEVDLKTAALTVDAGNGIDVATSTNKITIAAENATLTNPGIIEVADSTEIKGILATRAVTPNALNLSWTGSGNISTVGTIAGGTWQGSEIADSYIANNLTIVGGTINNTVIGATTAASASFTHVSASSSELTHLSASLVDVKNNLGVGGNLFVGGKLTVTGDTEILNTSTVRVDDNLIILNSGSANTYTNIDAGIQVNLGVGTTNPNFIYDTSAERWGFVRETTDTSGEFTSSVDYVATVSQSVGSPTLGTATPNYGTASNSDVFAGAVDTRLGAIHIQTGSDAHGNAGDVWIYS